MYELIQLGERTFYMDCPAKVGFFVLKNNQVALIDSGSDKDAAKKVKKILDSQGWIIKAIYNTHSHADHIGGNQYLQAQTRCDIYSPGVDLSVTRHTILEPSSLYGGCAMKELKNKFLMAKESEAKELTREIMPEGLNFIELPGHSYNQVGFKTSDNVIFLADSILSEETLEKYKISFIYDVEAYLSSLEKILTLEAGYFVPSHGPVQNEIKELVQMNIVKTYEIIDRIKGLLAMPKSFEELLSIIFTELDLTMNLQQRMLIGSTVKSYLTYLKDREEIEFFFENNMMFWKAI